MIAVFVLGYLAIALEHPIKIDKAASALFTGMVDASGLNPTSIRVLLFTLLLKEVNPYDY